LQGVTESVSIHKLRRDSVNFPFARSAKGLLQGVHSRPQEPKFCVRIGCKECTNPNLTKYRSNPLRSQRVRRRKLTRDSGINLQGKRSSEAFMSHQLRSIQEGAGSFWVVGSGQGARYLSLCVHTGAMIRQSPEEARDHPSSRGTGGTRSTTSEVCRQGESEHSRVETLEALRAEVNHSRRYEGHTSQIVVFE
jgi:hypothetical protein